MLKNIILVLTLELVLVLSVCVSDNSCKNYKKIVSFKIRKSRNKESLENYRAKSNNNLSPLVIFMCMEASQTYENQNPSIPINQLKYK